MNWSPSLEEIWKIFFWKIFQSIILLLFFFKEQKHEFSASKILGRQGGRENLAGHRVKKCKRSMQKFAILPYLCRNRQIWSNFNILVIIWGKSGGTNAPMPLCGTVIVTRVNFHPALKLILSLGGGLSFSSERGPKIYKKLASIKLRPPYFGKNKNKKLKKIKKLWPPSLNTFPLRVCFWVGPGWCWTQDW